MARRRLRTIGLGLIGFAAGCAIAAESQPISEIVPAPGTMLQPGNWNPSAWAPGATAPEEVIAPVTFSAPDPEASAQLQAQTAAEVTPILRAVAATADDALDNLDSMLVASRNEFQSAVAAEFGDLPLDAKAFIGDEFERFRLRWTTEHSGKFPPSSALARAWATQMDDAPLLTPWREALHATLVDNWICPTDTADAAPDSSAVYRLVVTSSHDEPITSTDVAQNAALINRGQLSTLREVREQFLQRFSTTEQAAGVLVSELLRPNTFLESALTDLERDEQSRHAATLSQEYPAGTAIVHKGDLIGPRQHAALTELQKIWATLPVRAPDRDEASEAAAPPLPPQVSPEMSPVAPLPNPGTTWISRNILVGIAILLGVVALLIAWLAFRQSRQSHQSALLAATSGDGASESPVVLALRDQTVQHLYSQRQTLLEDQSRSTGQVSELEARISRLKPQIQAKIRTYEERIKELESMLAAKQDVAADEVERELGRLRHEQANHVIRDPDTGGR